MIEIKKPQIRRSICPPLITVADTSLQKEGKGWQLSNAYTRLIITSRGIGVGEVVLDYEKENPLRRFLWVQNMISTYRFM